MFQSIFVGGKMSVSPSFTTHSTQRPRNTVLGILQNPTYIKPKFPPGSCQNAPILGTNDPLCGRFFVFIFCCCY
jgi:hypothetical protein